MTEFEKIEPVLSLFEEAVTKHAEASEIGDYKTANKNYDKVIKAIKILKEQDNLDQLLPFLSHSTIAVRVAAATFLLNKHERESIKVLKDVANSSHFHSLIAETTLSEWRKGNLKI